MAEDLNEIGAAATDYLRIFGLVTLAFMWSQMAIKAMTVDPDNTQAFYRGKRATANFYMAKLLPQINALMATMMTGADSLMDYPDDVF